MTRLKTWIEIDQRAVRENIALFRSFLKEGVQLWSVIKSNAYGHGLAAFAELANEGVDEFCVDSVIEGKKLREEGITKPILVLGPTLPDLLKEAVENRITITVSSVEALWAVINCGEGAPEFHLKIDTGMHRQGIYPNDLKEIIRVFLISNFEIRNKLKGVYTHFASAKDINYPTYTEKQFSEFKRATEILQEAGFTDLVKHAAATGGVLLNKQYHLDAVRVGIGLYGLWPSKELAMQLNYKLYPVLSWHSLISEVKAVKAGDYIGYDLVEKIIKDGKIAIVPIGYWHGVPRSLSGTGNVLINGERARILGRVSMDLTAVDVTDIECRTGDRVTLIGEQGSDRITSEEMASRAGTIGYEIITRINPLIERIVI